MSASDNKNQLPDDKFQEAQEFDDQTRDRLAHGFVPDLRRLQHVDWFYNNVWRDPEIALLHWQPRIEKIIAIAKETGGQVLELGCGCGMLSLEMARHGLHVTGVDLSPVSIEVANRFQAENPFTEGFGSLEYICGDFDELEYANGCYDSVVFFRSLHHFANLDAVLAKVARLLKPGGNLLLSEPVRAHFNQDSARVAALLRLVLPTWVPYSEKLAGDWTAQRIETAIAEVFEEYTYDGEHHQSALDNSTDNADDIIAAVARHMEIVEKSLSDAFTDKLLGGLRGDHRHEMARMLKAVDAYLIQNSLLPPTSLELHGRTP